MELKDLLVIIVNAFDKEFADFPFHEIPELSKLTVIQAQYLEEISRMENPTISELTKEFNVTKPTVSVIVDRLVRIGYIKKEKSDSDKRVSYLRLSDKGRELYKIYKEHDDKRYEVFINKIQKALSREDLKKFTEILHRIVERL